MKDESIVIPVTKVYSPYKQCYGKKQYEFKRRALKDARSLATDNPDSNFTVYECPHCGKFHVGKVRK